jgi:hypothetical protein
VNLPVVGPGEEPGGEVELAEEFAYHLIGIPGGTEPIQLSHDPKQRAVHVLDGALRIELPLLVQRTLAAEEFFTVEVRQAVDDAIAGLAGGSGEA